MNDRQAQIQELLKRFEEKSATDEEVDLLLALINDPSNDETTRSLLESRMRMYATSREELEYWKERFEGKLPTRPSLVSLKTEPIPALVKTGRTQLLRFMRYAAAVVIIAAGAFFAFNLTSKKKIDVPNDSQPVNLSKNDVAPGSNRAILKLSDGSSIVLDDASDGTIADQFGTSVIKKDDQIIYDFRSLSNDAPVAYNTMSTPRGGQYKLVLHDGTTVWLNAASSITFPTAFKEKERRVTVTGEVYFEVAKHASMPFKVVVDTNVEVEVLGTHFNINAYTDEPSIKTTLLEGAVNIKNGTETRRLIPGQQARVATSTIDVYNNVNTDQVVAWKNGAFSFYKDNASAVLRQLSRWYDVEIVYEDEVPQITFSGKMGRDLSLAQILKFLKDVNVNLKIEGKKVIVMKSNSD